MFNTRTIIGDLIVLTLDHNDWKSGMFNGKSSFFKGTKQINIFPDSSRPEIAMVLFDNNKHIITLTKDELDNPLLKYFVES